MKPQNDWKKYLCKEYRWLCGSKQRQAVTATNCRLKSASIGIIFREKKVQAQVENEKQCKAIRQHSVDKNAKKTSNEVKKTSDSPKNKTKTRLCLLSYCHERFSFQAAIWWIKLCSQKMLVVEQTICDFEVLKPVL